MSGPSEETFEVGGQTFHVDQVWQVDGLVAAATYNGKLGATKQAAGARHPGRVQVQLLSQPTVVLAIKPTNLKEVDVMVYAALPAWEKRALRAHSEAYHTPSRALRRAYSGCIGDEVWFDQLKLYPTLHEDCVYLTHRFHYDGPYVPAPDFQGHRDQEDRASQSQWDQFRTPPNLMDDSGAGYHWPMPSGDQDVQGMHRPLSRDDDVQAGPVYRSNAKEESPEPPTADPGVTPRKICVGEASWMNRDGTQRTIQAGEYDEREWLAQCFEQQLGWADAMKNPLTQ